MQSFNHEPDPPPSLAWLRGPGPMRHHLRTSKSTPIPLGPPEHWPAELRTAVALCLDTPLPACVYWGPQALPICNDAFLQLLPPEQPPPFSSPLADGSDAEALHRLFQQVFAGTPVLAPPPPSLKTPHHPDLRWTGSFSPLRNAAGEVLGVYQTVLQPPTPTALQDTEHRFTAFADAIPTLAWMANADGWITWYNQRWYQYTGTTPEQMAGWGWQSVHEPRVLPTVMERWSRSIDTGQPFQMIFPLRGADGVFRSFLTRVSPVLDHAGKVTQWFGTNTEIDEFQRTRDALQASEEELRYTLEFNPQIPWTGDAQGNILDFNPRWLEITGLTRQQALGDGWRQVQHPDDQAATAAAWQHAIDTGSPCDFEHRIRTASGDFQWSRTRAFPRRDHHGHILKWYGTTENIDPQKAAQSALAQSEERLRLATTAVPSMGTFDWNVPDDRLHLDRNLSLLFGVDPATGAAGIPITDFTRILHPDDCPRVQAAIERTLGTGAAYAEDYRILHPDESIHWISARGSCLFDAHRTPRRFLGVCLDISQRKLTEQALIQNEKLAAVGRLAASIAHEINNPLESVTNLIYLARQSTQSPEALEYLAGAEQELRRVSAISGQTLRFHRQSTQPTLVSCEELFLTTLSIYQGRLQNTGVAVEKRKRARRPVLCFEGEIRQVLSNLVGNAIDAMAPASGRLLLRSREATHWRTGTRGLVLTVADTGPGMSAHTARKAFEAFFTTKEAAGTGLGLWISHEIVTRHHGSLRFRTRQHPTHSGTVFSLFLPYDPALTT